MDQPESAPPSRTVIGGRHGSPSVTVAFPFSKVVTTDDELRDLVIDLADLVGAVASAVADDDTEALRTLSKRADQLATTVRGDHRSDKATD